MRASSGDRHPFLRGMVTHDLVQRGLSFDDAYATARALRDRVADRGEISTGELEELIDRQLVETFGAEAFARLEPPARARPELSVVYHGEPQPFSRGLLARSINAAGVDLDRAYRLVTELEGELRGERVARLTSDEVARRVGDLLERREGAETAGRYRTRAGHPPAAAAADPLRRRRQRHRQVDPRPRPRAAAAHLPHQRHRQRAPGDADGLLAGHPARPPPLELRAAAADDRRLRRRARRCPSPSAAGAACSTAPSRSRRRGCASGCGRWSSGRWPRT